MDHQPPITGSQQQLVPMQRTVSDREERKTWTTMHWRGPLAHLYSLPVTTCVAVGLTRADVQWSIHVLSLSLCFPSSITQAHAEAILIIAPSPPCTNGGNENKTLFDAHSPKPNLSITVAHAFC